MPRDDLDGPLLVRSCVQDNSESVTGGFARDFFRGGAVTGGFARDFFRGGAVIGGLACDFFRGGAVIRCFACDFFRGGAVTGGFACDFFHLEEFGGLELNRGHLVHREAAAVRAGQAQLGDQGAQQHLGAAVDDDLVLAVMELNCIGHEIGGESVRNNSQSRHDSVLRRVGGFHGNRFAVHDVVDIHGLTVDHGVLHAGHVDGLRQRDRHDVLSALGQDRFIHGNLQAHIAGLGVALRLGFPLRKEPFQRIHLFGNRHRLGIFQTEGFGNSADIGIAHAHLRGRQRDRPC